MTSPCTSQRLLPAQALILAALLLGSAPAQALPETLPAGSPNEPVAQLDLSRYLGTWHEVARLPMFFQRNCARDTTAVYTQTTEGRVRVTNRCIKANGEAIESVGLARTTPREGALEVTFLPAGLRWLPGVWSDYWVVDLDPDYQWVVVGGPSQGALWVLSREPHMEPELLDRLKQRATARGYVLDDLIVAAP